MGTPRAANSRLDSTRNLAREKGLLQATPSASAPPRHRGVSGRMSANFSCKNSKMSFVAIVRYQNINGAPFAAALVFYSIWAALRLMSAVEVIFAAAR